jgi:hypothetical protein
MKRVTILLDDWLYRGLLEYAADMSKRDIERMSLSKVVRDLLAVQLQALGYPHTRASSFSQEEGIKIPAEKPFLLGKDFKIPK